MGNWIRCSGVYTNMRRVLLILVCSLAGLAQRLPQQNPLDQAILAAWQADNSHLQEATAARERARVLLRSVPVGSSQFTGWAQQVAQLYRNASLNAQARAVLQEALARTESLGDSHPTHIAMLDAMGEAWRQDGNLLKAVAYLEQAAAAQAGAPPAGAAQPVAQGLMAFGNRAYHTGFADGRYFGSGIYVYARLAGLYQQLGRQDTVAAMVAKIRTLAGSDQSAVAQFLEQQGQLEEAAAIYRSLAEQAVNPQAQASAWQSLANLDARQDRYTDAIDAIQQAIAAVQSSSQPGASGQAFWMRQNLASYLRNAGLVDQAGQVYRQLVEESRGGPQETQLLGAYAGYLAGTERGAQGESLLKDYLASLPDQNWQQKTNLLYGLADLARRRGDLKGADEYDNARRALDPQPTPPPAGQSRIGDELQEAQTALNQQRLDDAFRLALDAMESAVQAAEGQQVQWRVPQIANTLATYHEAAKGERLYQRLLDLAAGWKAGAMQPLLNATQNHAHFLMGQRNLWSDVPAAIRQYRDVLVEANGSDSASLVEPLRMEVEFARSRLEWQEAEALARELLEFEESLNGNTSEPYLGDLQTAARVFQDSGDSARALPLFRQAMTLADLLSLPNTGWRRSQTRMDAAFALAHLGQFDEAETLAREAVELQRTLHLPGPQWAGQLEQVRQMKQAAAAAAANRANQ
jgi:hypothetical protein